MVTRRAGVAAEYPMEKEGSVLKEKAEKRKMAKQELHVDILYIYMTFLLRPVLS